MAARTFAQHDEHAARELVERFVRVRALVIRDHTGRGVGIEVVIGDKRGMSVHEPRDRPQRHLNAGEGFGIRCLDARVVHHLTESEDLARMLCHERPHVRSRDARARLLVRERRHA